MEVFGVIVPCGERRPELGNESTFGPLPPEFDELRESRRGLGLPEPVAVSGASDVLEVGLNVRIREMSGL